MILVDRMGHLVSDANLSELHYFAKRVGLRESWFQDKRIPHYDLRGVMMQRALVKGAVMVTSRDIVERAIRKEKI